MFHFELLDKLLKDYKLWTLKLKVANTNIENTILQNDESDALEEKIVSVGISFIFMWIVGGIIGLFISGGNIAVSIVLFIIGWILSRFLNHKIFGKPRKYEDLKEDEKNILDSLKNIQKTHIQIRDGIKNKTRKVYFKDYPKLKVKFKNMIRDLNNLDKSHLALKYRTKYGFVVQSYKNEIKNFNTIFANK